MKFSINHRVLNRLKKYVTSGKYHDQPLYSPEDLWLSATEELGILEKDRELLTVEAMIEMACESRGEKISLAEMYQKYGHEIKKIIGSNPLDLIDSVVKYMNTLTDKKNLSVAIDTYGKIIGIDFGKDAGDPIKYDDKNSPDFIKETPAAGQLQSLTK